MSWHYSAVLVEEFSERGLLVTRSSQRLRAIRTASRSCFDARRTGHSTPSQSGMTSKPSTDFLFVGSMWSVPAFPANPSVQQDSNEEKMTTETSGLIQRECLGRYEAESCCLRTLPDCFGCTEELSSVTLPAWGTIVGGELYPLAPLVPPISGRDGGVWPTPTVGDSKSSGSRNTAGSKAHAGISLTDAVRGDGGKGRQPWPTPTASDHKGGGTGAIRKDTGSPRKDRLDHILEPGESGKLNPDWVEFLMQWPTGWTSLDPLPEGTMEAWEASVKAGTYWDVDPADTGEVSRLTDTRLHRAARLKAIGNGQVPAQLVLAAQCLGEKA
jgi:hypothetical protein